MPAQFIPVVGDKYKVINHEWSHEFGSTVIIADFENNKIWWEADEKYRKLWIDRSKLNTDMVVYLGSTDKAIVQAKAIEQAKDGLEKLLGIA